MKPPASRDYLHRDQVEVGEYCIALFYFSVLSLALCVSV